MKRLFFTLIFLFCALPAVLHALQETPALRLEITGLNASELPTITVTANVYDTLGQPVRGLTADNFSVFGALEDIAEIVSVENISDDNLPFATVLIMDISDSMTGFPMERAQEAARTFVDSIADNDPVAIVTFGNRIRLVQDYTTDKAALLSAIDSLGTGGQTALYQGAYEGIEVAADSPEPRRAAILLSDGAEYGGISRVTPPEVFEQALARGVPVYTIGLGYGFDRTFLQALSEGTNARFYESPDPEQLVEIYSDLAALLRSQYVITLSADLPLDGSEYDFGLEVVSGDAAASAETVLRAPIPVPIVQLSGLPDAPIEVPTTVTADVLADDALSSVRLTIGDQTVTLVEEPYTFTIDPVAYLPGDYALAVEAVDEDGDVGSAEAALTVAALPSVVTLSPDLSTLGEIDEPITVTVEVSGQTPAVGIEYLASGPAFADEQFRSLEGTNAFTVDPQELTAGDNQLIVRAINESGIVTTATFPFTVAALPPVITLDGVQDGQIIDSPITFTVIASGQTPDINISAAIGGETITPDDTQQRSYTAISTFTIDPIQLEPGAQILQISATSENDETATQQINVIISALPPIILVSGLVDGDVLAEETRVDLDFISQTPITQVALFLDESELVTQTSAPFGITLSPLVIAPGEHTLRVAVDNASSQHSTLDIAFSVPEGPSLTATALAPTPTPLPTETPDAGATQAQQATLSFVRTITAEAINAQTATQEQMQSATANADATGTAVRTTATAAALATADAALQATSQAASLATENAASTATQQALATLNANATATTGAQIALNVQSTADQATNQAQASATALEATQDARASATAAQATENAQATATPVQATRNAAASATAVQVTQQAQASATAAQATERAQATENVQATRTASQATERSQASATAAQATENAQATRSAAQVTQNALATATSQQATMNAANSATAALATENALATETPVQATMNAEASATAAQATENAQASATAQMLVSATANARATSQAVAQQLAMESTRSALATSNAQARMEATQTADVRATRTASFSATQEANASATAQAATEAADAQATSLARSNATATELAQFFATATAYGEVTLTQAALQTQQFSEQATSAAQAILDANVTETQAAAVTETAVAAQQRTQDANATATHETQATASFNQTATARQQATIDTQLAAIGTTTPPASTPEPEEPESTAVAQVASTSTARPSPSPQPTLTLIEAENPPSPGDVVPTLIVGVLAMLVLIVLILIIASRRRRQR